MRWFVLGNFKSVLFPQRQSVKATRLIQSCHALKVSSFICDIF